jgi:GMP synthase (glutamine-hydrolysing)
VNVLAIVHGEDAPPGSFGEVVRARGHRIETWSVASGKPLPESGFDAVMVFGGAMHADQEAHHPWLRDEHAFIEGLLDAGIPMLGVCLGAQLMAKAAGAVVAPATEPEIGWLEVELTEGAAADPVFAGLPRRFDAFQWHFYAFDVPAGAHELARSRVCSQAFRLGDAAWGVQFHPEVTREIVATWVADESNDLPGGHEAFLAEADRRLDAWERLGRSLCGAFLDASER